MNSVRLLALGGTWALRGMRLRRQHERALFDGSTSLRHG